MLQDFRPLMEFKHFVYRYGAVGRVVSHHSLHFSPLPLQPSPRAGSSGHLNNAVLKLKSRDPLSREVLHKALLATDPLPKPMGDVIDHRFGRQHSVPSESGGQAGAGTTPRDIASLHLHRSAGSVAL